MGSTPMPTLRKQKVNVNVKGNLLWDREWAAKLSLLGRDKASGKNRKQLADTSIKHTDKTAQFNSLNCHYPAWVSIRATWFMRKPTSQTKRKWRWLQYRRDRPSPEQTITVWLFMWVGDCKKLTPNKSCNKWMLTYRLPGGLWKVQQLLDTLS